MVRRWARTNLVCLMFLPLLALAQEPAAAPQAGTADTTPPDPTIIDPVLGAPRLDPLSDDPGAGIHRPEEPLAPTDFAYELPDPVTVPFIDRAHLGVWNAVWRSAMHVDGWFGA